VDAAVVLPAKHDRMTVPSALPADPVSKLTGFQFTPATRPSKLAPLVISRTRGPTAKTTRRPTQTATHDKIIVVGMWSRKPRHEPAQGGTEQPDAPQKPLRSLDFAASRGSPRHGTTSALGGF